MATSSPAPSLPVVNQPASDDLGPLAWVLGEVQKSLDHAARTLRRFAREAGSIAEQDAAPLRQARQQLHQAVGALQMVGHPAPALVLGSVEFAIQSFVLEPSKCNEVAVRVIERAGFAVSEFLGAVIAGKHVSPVALFPQYRDVLELVGNERVHPADLWGTTWRWAEIRPAHAQTALVYDPAVRSKLDREVLSVVKNGDDHAARRLQALCLGLGRGSSVPRVASFWTLAAGFFEALSCGLIAADSYAKRAASRVLLQYATLARGDTTVSDRLGQDLLFFCAQAVPGSAEEAPTLRAVRAAWGVANEQAVDYTLEQFGRFDPAVLAQARKRIETAKEMWTSLSGGDVTRLAQVGEAFSQLGESLQKLHPASGPLADALEQAVDASVRSGRPPATELAMEVATSVLYLEAAFADLDPQDRQLTARTVQLAGRIDRVREGGHSEPLEAWMEELYRRVSDRQTMGTVVDELRSHLSECEKSLDQYFRRPAEKKLLRDVPTQLAQMRGVFSVLGLDQAAQAVQRMREHVEQLLAHEGQAQQAIFDLLGNNLGALGFLIDMLSYQPAVAKRLFVFDAQAGELKPLMGRQASEAAAEARAQDAVPEPREQAADSPVEARHSQLSVEQVDAEIAARLAALATSGRKAPTPIEEIAPRDTSWTSRITGPAPLEPMADTEVNELDEDDLQDIFLEEAREVLHNGLAAVAALGSQPDDHGELTVLRRAFHTLKGSARMVRLMDFGDAAWAFEQQINSWLADQRPATPAMLDVTRSALIDFSKWVEAIAAGEPHAWVSEPFKAQAESLAGADTLQPAPRVADVDALVAAARVMADAPAQTPATSDELPVDDRRSLPAADLADLDLDLGFDAQANRERDGHGLEAADSQNLPAGQDHDGPREEFPATDFLDFEPALDPEPLDEASNAAELEDIDFLETAQSPMEAFPPEKFESDDLKAGRPAQKNAELKPPSESMDDPVIEGLDALTGSAEPRFDPEFAPRADFEPTPRDADMTDMSPLEEFDDILERMAREEKGLHAPEAVDIERRESAFDAEPFGSASEAGRHEPVFDAEPPADTPSPAAEPASTPPLPLLPIDSVAQAAPLSAAAAEARDSGPVDDQVKVIGPLRIGHALYNVYLTEADEWSRHLVDELQLWSHEPQERLADSTIGLAHSLAGSSATVGFSGLSGMARLMEGALLHLQTIGRGSASQADTLLAAAEEMRRLLHQFAAGFLREPTASTLEALRSVAESSPGKESPEEEAAAALAADARGDAEDRAQALARAAQDALELSDAYSGTGTSQAQAPGEAHSHLAQATSRAAQVSAGSHGLADDAFAPDPSAAKGDVVEPASVATHAADNAVEATRQAEAIQAAEDSLATQDEESAAIAAEVASAIEADARAASIADTADAADAPSTEPRSGAAFPQAEANRQSTTFTPQPSAADEPDWSIPRPSPTSAPDADTPRRLADVTLDDGDESGDIGDGIDADLFPIFEEEAAELLPHLSVALRQWLQEPGNPAPRASALRTLHTLKGSARLAGAMRLGERAHRLESRIEGIGVEDADRAALEQLLERFDGLQASFDALRLAQDPETALGAIDDSMASAVAASPAVSGPAPEPVAPVASTGRAGGNWADVLEAPAAGENATDEAEEALAPASIETNDAGEPVLSDTEASEASAPAPSGLLAAPPKALTPLRPRSSQVVRIRTQLLDRLMTQAGEVIITRSRMEAQLAQLRSSLSDLTGNLDRLRQQLRDVEVQAESQMQSRLAQAKDTRQSFDPLEFDRFTRVQELTRMMAESVNDVATVQRTLQKTMQATEDDLSAQARQTRELQRGLLRTRMVEFDGASERLYRVVRQAAKDTGKQVRLDIVGGNIEMDRGVLERMMPAFEHLLRNSIAHGIESPEARSAAGKEAAGLIQIELAHAGNDVSVVFRDDGAGLDAERVAERAKAMGLLPEAATLDADQVAEMIFKPGFSTAREVSELAGRGIGMDVVRAQVAGLGGRIETRSEAGRGTSFRLVLPLTTAVTHVVMLRMGATSVGVPSNLVELVQRVGASDTESAYRSQDYGFAGERVPFYAGSALMQQGARSKRAIGKTNTIVIVRSAAQRVALHVDEVLGNQEVVVKNLGPQLSRLPGMAGISVLASGEVAMIFNPVALAAVHGDAARRLQSSAVDDDRLDATTPARPATLAPLVLVVDDSITVRRVTQRLLQREGFRVLLASDGLHALERLQQERPAVVLSDIEMPRMDGFDLARNIRADGVFADLPIIMITSRIAEKHRDHARTLGVNHYLGKPYSEDELLRLVRHYANVEAPNAALAA